VPAGLHPALHDRVHPRHLESAEYNVDAGVGEDDVEQARVVIALWLWMARVNSQGRNWARILSTVLLGLATLKLIGVFSEPRTVLGLIFWAPAWLVGLAAVWLLWRPDCSAFFKPRGAAPGLHEVRVV
jgi:hypothetical protein